MKKTAESPAVPKAGAAKAAEAATKPLTPGDFVSNADRALKTMGLNIRNARKEIYRLTQAELAEQVGIHPRMLRKIELGESVPSMYLMLVLAAMRRHLPVVTAANPRVSELLVPADSMPSPFTVCPIAGTGGSSAIAQARKSLRNTAHPPRDGVAPQPPEGGLASEHSPQPSRTASPPTINPISPFGHIAPINRPR